MTKAKKTKTPTAIPLDPATGIPTDSYIESRIECERGNKDTDSDPSTRLTYTFDDGYMCTAEARNKVFGNARTTKAQLRVQLLEAVKANYLSGAHK